MVRKDTGFQIFAHVFMIILGITVVFPMALLIIRGGYYKIWIYYIP